jgi:type II secretory pathway component PulF
MVFTIVTIELLLIVPWLTKRFVGLGAKLPPMTVLLIDMSSWWRSYWLLLAILVLTIYVGALCLLVRRGSAAARISTYGVIGLLILFLLFSMVALYLPLLTLQPS